MLSCLGDDHAYSLIHTPKENTLSDKVALHTLKNKENFKAFSFLIAEAMKDNTMLRL